MGESISEATIGSILKPSGSRVKMDEEILEFETDKLNQVFYAPQAGIVSLQIKQGDVIRIGQVIGFIDTEGKEVKISEEKPQSSKPVESSKPIQIKKPSIEIPKKTAVLAPVRFEKDEWVKEIQGVGSQEVIPKEKSTKTLPLEPRSETRKKLSKVRKIIAERMLEAKQSTAMLTTFNEVDMSCIIHVREKYKEAFTAKYGVKLGFMSFFVKACSSALQAFPEVNSYLDGDEQVFRNYEDISIAISTEKGLIVPVLRNCQDLSFAEIEKAIIDFASRAKTGNLTVDELKGGGFTITNGGVFGSLLSTPLLNPPQCAILGMHKITKRPVVVDDQIVICPMMYLALSYDHRVLDGKEAVSFLIHIKESLEDLERWVIEV